MANKLLGIAGSVRFWGLVAVAALTIYMGDMETLKVIQYWLLGVVGIGTLDSVSAKIGGK